MQGHCPACGQTKLAASQTGVLVCCNLDCPRPTALAELIATSEVGHVVQLDRHDFDLQHPLLERLDGGLFACELTDEIAVSGPPAQTGRFHVHLGPTGLEFTPTEGDRP